MKSGLELITEERQRQLAKWPTKHDVEEHADGSLLMCARAVLCTLAQGGGIPAWPQWANELGTRMGDEPAPITARLEWRVAWMATAAALLASEIDRVRANQRSELTADVMTALQAAEKLLPPDELRELINGSLTPRTRSLMYGAAQSSWEPGDPICAPSRDQPRAPHPDGGKVPVYDTEKRTVVRHVQIAERDPEQVIPTAYDDISVLGPPPGRESPNFDHLPLTPEQTISLMSSAADLEAANAVYMPSEREFLAKSAQSSWEAFLEANPMPASLEILQTEEWRRQAILCLLGLPCRRTAVDIATAIGGTFPSEFVAAWSAAQP